jgi:RecA/RadA recombinase
VSEAPTVAAQLSMLRRDRFVGRLAELAAFSELLSSNSAGFRMVWVYGPGGVGKTYLCTRFAEIALAAGRTVATVDARDLDLTRDAWAEALGEPVPGQVTIIDTFERCAPLEAWLREAVLPRWPADTVLVVAGRYAPSAGWLGDPAWQSLLRPVPLRNLSPDESRALLRSRGVVGTQQDLAVNLTHGHPLALALVADTLASGRRLEPVGVEQEPELMRVLLERFIDQVPSPRHRAALEVCAHVRVTTEEVLAEVLGDREFAEMLGPRDSAELGESDTAELFAWLRGLSFVQQGPHGLFPHDLARDVIDADLRWRNPARYRQLHAVARAAAVRRIQSTDGVRHERALFDFLFMHRTSGLMSRYMDWETFGTIRPAAATAETLPEILAIVHRHEGEASSAIARRWYERQPHGFWVFRDSADEIVGFQATLALHEASAEDIAADPATAAGLAYARAYAPLRPGDAILYHRFHASRDTYQSVSAATNLFSVMATRYWLTTPRLAWAFLAVADADYWEPLMSYLGFRRCPEAEFEVDRRYGVFSHDWRAEPLAVWFEVMEERELTTSAEAVAPPAAPGPALVVLSEPEFTAAVRQALRLYTRPDALAASPLLRSRVTTESAGPKPSPEDLRRVIREAAEALMTNPRDEKLYRAVHRTYLQPAATQELAAQQLGLPFSTYRRHLTAGVDRICAWLWRRELAGDPGAPPTPSDAPAQ